MRHEIYDPETGALMVSDLPEPPPTLQDYTAAIDNHIENAAMALGYSSGVSLASYVSSSVPQWAAEASRFVSWRDAVWVAAYTTLGQVTAGQRAQPSIYQLIEELPVFA